MAGIWLVNGLKDDRHCGVDGSVSMKALEGDLFEQSVQIRR